MKSESRRKTHINSSEITPNTNQYSRKTHQNRIKNTKSELKGDRLKNWRDTQIAESQISSKSNLNLRICRSPLWLVADLTVRKEKYKARKLRNFQNNSL